jgi:hypothetical protein
LAHTQRIGREHPFFMLEQNPQVANPREMLPSFARFSISCHAIAARRSKGFFAVILAKPFNFRRKRNLISPL